MTHRSLLVLGASGGVGREVLAQGLEAGHSITAVTRSRSAITTAHPRLTVHEADALDPRALTPITAGHDAVIVVLGGGRKGGVRGPGTAAAIAAMQEAGVRRLVVQSSLGVGDSRPALTPFWKYVMFGLLLREGYADHHEQERVTRASGLDWTITRPGAFVDGPRTRRYRRGFPPVRERRVATISRPDVADLLLELAVDGGHLHEAVAQGHVTGAPLPEPLSASGARSA